MFVIVSGAAIWVYATNYADVTEASETLKDGHVIVLSLIENNSTLINISLDRRYFYENLLIIVEVKAI